MEKYLARCDHILYFCDYPQITGRSPRYTKGGKEYWLELLSFSTRFKLVDTQGRACRNVIKLVEQFLLGAGDHESFTLVNTRQLVELLLPMHLGDTDALEISEQSLNKLWYQVRSCLDLSVLSIDVVNDAEKLSLLVHHGLHCRHNKMKSDLKRLTSKWIGKKGLSISDAVIGQIQSAIRSGFEEIHFKRVMTSMPGFEEIYFKRVMSSMPSTALDHLLAQTLHTLANIIMIVGMRWLEIQPSNFPSKA